MSPGPSWYARVERPACDGPVGPKCVRAGKDPVAARLALKSGFFSGTRPPMPVVAEPEARGGNTQDQIAKLIRE